MTREEFINGYLSRSGLEQYRTADGYTVGDSVRVALPCTCGAAGCEGWAMIGAENATWHCRCYAGGVLPAYLTQASLDAVSAADAAFEAALAAQREASMSEAETRELPAQPEEVLREALKLAKTLRDRHYPEVTQWEPAGDLVGLLLQIDNMTAGLSRPIAPEDSETCALCEFPILSDDELELDEDGEAMHRGCRKLATREMERAAAEASRSPRPAEASAPVAEGVRNERFIMEDDDGPTVGILIDLPDGTQIWSSDISSATFAEQTNEVREVFDGHGTYVVRANRGNGIEIIAQVPTVDLGIEVARAVAAAALRSANARQPSKRVDRG